MRTRMTTKPWFGPKRSLGWGWTPVSWEGWVASGGSLALIIAANAIWNGTRAVVAVVIVVVVFLGLVLATGDPPGGPGSRR